MIDSTMRAVSPSSSRRRSATLEVLVAVTATIAGGCDQTPATSSDGDGDASTAATTSTTASTTDAPAAAGRRGYEIPIPQLEYWADTQTPKYRYEMRFDPPEKEGGGPRLHRNGWAQAYYLSGGLEREGAYRYVAANGRSERVGRWTYYTPEGTVDRIEERGGEVIWTGPDQLIAPPEEKSTRP